MSTEQQEQIKETINGADFLHSNVAMCCTIMMNLLNTKCENELQQTIKDRIEPCVKALQNTLILTNSIITDRFNKECDKIDSETPEEEA